MEKNKVKSSFMEGYEKFLKTDTFKEMSRQPTCKVIKIARERMERLDKKLEKSFRDGSFSKAVKKVTQGMFKNHARPMRI